jgi:murein L,D-transpeptidase YcbB/YkuD
MRALTALTCPMNLKHRRISRLLRSGVLLTAAFGVTGCADLDQAFYSDRDLYLSPMPSARSVPVITNTVNVRPANTQTPLQTLLWSGNQSREMLVFYHARDFKPAWSGGLLEEQAGRHARAILARAHEHGLRDEDYKSPEYTRPLSMHEAARYDLALTEAVLRYAHDVRAGRIRPNNIYKDVSLPADDFDAAAELNHAINNHDIAGFFDALPPAHPEYQRLVLALAQYRDIASEGGWPSVIEKGDIRFEGDNPQRTALVTRLSFEDPILAAIPKPSAIEIRDAIIRFQTLHGLNADGRLGSETRAALNVSASVRAEQIAANMERWRWMPRQFENRYIAVNVPDQSLDFVHNGEVVLTSRVIVGRKASPTPITRSTIEAVVANPPWNIPGYIAARDLLPHLRRNADYLTSKNMVVMDAPPDDPHGRTIDWRNIKAAEFPYAIRQLPGPGTALGQIMLDSPNDFDVYLHDTPNKNLFASNQREISNGCVRVQQIFSLASLAIADDESQGEGMITQALETHETQRIALAQPLPVYFLYWTAAANAEGEVQFRPDRYNRDAPLIALLSQPSGSTISKDELSDGAPEMQENLRDTEDLSP